MKYFCHECLRPVPQFRAGDDWKAGRCRLHPDALRVSEKYRNERLQKFYSDARAAIDGVPSLGIATRSDTSLSLDRYLAGERDERRAA